MFELYTEALSILNNSFIIFLYCLLGGLVPALFWLWFWMHEDNEHKEPRKILILTFLLGMLGVFSSILFQRGLAWYFNYRVGSFDILQNYSTINLIFVIIEEVIKYGAAYTIFFRTKIFNEPIDAFIYLMTAAIGFAAMENALYLIEPLIQGQTIQLWVESYLRFIGANVLHVASSGILALFIGYSFYKKPFMREIYTWFGLISAIGLHWVFNFILLKEKNSAVFVFLIVWVAALFIILSLEKVKRMKNPNA